MKKMDKDLLLACAGELLDCLLDEMQEELTGLYDLPEEEIYFSDQGVLYDAGRTVVQQILETLQQTPYVERDITQSGAEYYRFSRDVKKEARTL